LSCEACTRGGLFAGGEGILFKPHQTAGNQGATGAPISADSELASRNWIGYDGGHGWGGQVTWLQFDHGNTAAAAAGLDRIDYQLQVFDADLVHDFKFGKASECWMSFGLRYAQYDEFRANFADENAGQTGQFTSTQRWNFSGFGPRIGVELRHPFSDAWLLFVNFRTAALYGDQDRFENFALTRHVEDSLVFVYESQFGGEWRRRLRTGTMLYVRSALEVQFWNGVAGHTGTDGGNSFGLVGATLGGGWRY